MIDSGLPSASGQVDRSSRWIAPGRVFVACALVLAVLITPLADAETRGGATSYFLVRYSPGVNWNHQIGYMDQPGLKAHHEYLDKLHSSHRILLSGPLLSEPGAMSLLRIGSLEEANRLVEMDPGIQTRILNAELIPWNVELSSLPFVPHRMQVHPGESTESLEGNYRLRRIDPDSRINLNDGRQLE